MTQEAFEAEVIRLTESMYRMSYALLPRIKDRQDAVKSAIMKAWQYKDRLRTLFKLFSQLQISCPKLSL